MMEALLTSSVLILALALPRRALRGRIDPRLQYGLWLLVALRLLIPGSLFPAPVTVAGALSAWEEARAEAVQVQEAPADETTQIPAGGTVLPVLGSLYDAYPEAPDLSSETAPGQPLQEVPSGDSPASGGAADRDPGPQAAGQDDSGWSMPFWRWTLYGGAALVGAALVGSNLRFYLSLRKRRRLIPPETLPVPCGTRVYLAEGIPSPCLAGLLRPAIYLNEAALDPGRLEHILVHEEIHRRHGDHLWGLVRGVCLALYWYDPLVWWAAALSRRDCELACDHSAIRRLGEARRLDYGQTLLAMVAPGRPLAGLLRTATTMTEGKRTMKERVALIVRRPRMLKITLAAVTAAAIALVALTFGGVWEAAGADGEIDGSVVPPEDTEMLNRREGVYTFLMVGTNNPGGTTDALILAIYDTVNDQIGCLSIPRDIAVDVPWDFKKIGSVYYASPTRGGGMEGLKTQVSQLTGIYPDYSFVVDLEAVAQIVDALGGVEFDVPLDMDYDDEWQDLHIHLSEGRQTLDGEAAAGLIRWRRSNNGPGYPDSDIGRITTQQSFLEALARKCLSLESWSQVLSLADIVMGSVETDLSTGNLLWFAQQAMDLDGTNLQFFTVPGDMFVYAEGTSYSFADPEAMVELVNQHLNPYTQPISALDLHIMGVDENGKLTAITGETDSEGDLATTTYTHSSGMFSLSLPEEWVNAVVYTETEDGVDFFEANTYAEAGYGWLASVRPQPASWVADHAGDPLTSLGGFDTNGVPQQYVLEYRMAWDFEAEPAAAAYEETARALLDLRDQIGFRLSVTPELISQLIHDSYGGDMADAIPFLPYLSWSSYRDAYGGDGLLALLDALGAYASSGRADWGQYHDILSAPVDSAIDGAYAEAYQEMVWSLYRASSADFSSVLLSDFITDEERDNAVYWLRAPMARADGLEEPLSDEAVRVRLGLIEAAEAARETPSLSDTEAIINYRQDLTPFVEDIPACPDGEVIYDTPVVESPEEAILLTLETHARSCLGGYFHQILLDDVTYAQDESGAFEEAVVSYRVQAASSFTLPSGSPYTLTMETPPFTTTFTLMSRTQLFLKNMDTWERLTNCFDLSEISVPAGTYTPPRQLILDAVNANLAAQGLEEHKVDTLELSSQPYLPSLAAGERVTVTFDFTMDAGPSGTQEVTFVITE